MKFYTKLLFVFILGLQLNIFPQILNAGFEDWTDEDPNDWATTDFVAFWNAVSESSDNHSGSSAAKLEILNFNGSPVYPLLIGGETAQGFAVSERHGSLNGFYKFLPTNANTLVTATIVMYNNNHSNFVGAGSWSTSQTVNSYTQFSIPISYISAEIPDTAHIQFIVVDTSQGGGLGSVGTYALIDDLSWGGPADVQLENLNPSSFNLMQNYPNPFNPATKINFSITEQSFVELIVYDILGNEISILVSDNYSAGEYSVDFNAENLPNGIYIAKMNAGKYSKAIKMTLLK